MPSTTFQIASGERKAMLPLCDRRRLEEMLDRLQHLATQLDVLGVGAQATLAEMIGNIAPVTPAAAVTRLEAAAREAHSRLDCRKGAGLRAVRDEVQAISRLFAAMTADGRDMLAERYIACPRAPSVASQSVAGQSVASRSISADTVAGALFSAVTGLLQVRLAA